MATMRAKMYVTKVEKHGEPTSCVTLAMSCVCPNKFEADGSSEDNSFSRWSPSGGFNIMIQNPNLFDAFHVNQKFYLDFEEAPDSPPAPSAQADGANG